MNARARQIAPEQSDDIRDSEQVIPYRLSRPQLVITWGIVGLMLLAVFFFGFYSGRKQGIELALTEQSVPRLRLPVEVPKARAALSTSPVTNETISPPTTKFDFTDTKPEPTTLTPDIKDRDGIVPEPKIESKVDLTSGFVGRAANEVISPHVEQRDSAPSITGEQSLADRVAKVELSPTLENRSVEQPKVEKLKVKAAGSITNEQVKASTLVGPNERQHNIEATTISKKAATKSASKPVIGLYVQVGAPDSFSKAQTIVSKLRSHGITAAVRDASVNNKIYYRVLVGPFSSRNNAQIAKNQVLKSGVAMGEPFIKNF